MNENIFEQATRVGLRFEYKGSIGVEDLWELSLDALDSIHRDLTASVKQSEGGLLVKKTYKNKELELKIAVVAHVFEVKQAELEEKKNAAEKRAKKEKLKEILERKQDGALENKSAEEIQAMIDQLG